jgi:signal transduction histidine kinase
LSIETAYAILAAMRKDSRLRLFLAVFSVVLHLSAFLYLQSIEWPFSEIHRWTLQYVILLGLSFLLNVAFIYLDDPTKSLAITAVFGFHMVVLVVLLYPLSPRFLLRFILLLTLFIPTGLIRSYPKNIVLSVVAILFFVVFTSRTEVRAFGVRYEGAAVHESVAFIVFMLTVSATSCFGGIEHGRNMLLLNEINHYKNYYKKGSLVNLRFFDLAVRSRNEATIAERKRITREIHDTVGYTLTNILMITKTARLLLPSQLDRLSSQLQKLQVHAEEGIVEIRSTLHGLRDSVKQDDQDLASIHRMIFTFSEATGARVSVDYSDTPFRMDPDTYLFLYRLVQEGMLNAFKHGDASLITIRLRQNDGCIEAIIRDNGRGSEVVKKGIGLKGMEERASRLNGSVTTSSDELGFKLVATVPWRANRNERQN